MKDLLRFQDLILHCEALATRRPALYRLRVYSLGLLGFAYFALLIVFGVATSVGLILVATVGHLYLLLKFCIVPLAFSGTLLGALRIKIEPPAGVPVTRKTAPLLFKEIDDCRRTLGCLPIHRVLIQPEELNASVQQVPRLGVFGWPRTYLVLGLPLLEVLTLEEFRAVLGHELGHLSRTQRRLSNWVYRARRFWPRALESVHKKHGWASRLIEPFLSWYAPFFNAYSFVLARANEYEADLAGARIAGTANSAKALVATAVAGDYLGNRAWDAIYRQAADRPQPPKAPFAHYLHALRSIGQTDVDLCLRHATARQTTLLDTHPCLIDRVSALGQSVEPPKLAAMPASQMLLGPLRDSLIAQVDGQWQERFGLNWQKAHVNGLALRQEISAYEGKAFLSPDECLDYAHLLEGIGEPEKALPLLERALAEDAGNAIAFFTRGRLRLARYESGGAEDIEKAIALDPAIEQRGLDLLYGYFMRTNDIARAHPYSERLNHIAAQREAAEKEWLTTKPTDSFSPQLLSEAQLETFKAALVKEPRVTKAWLVRKHLKLSPERCVYIAVVKSTWAYTLSQAQLNRLVDALPHDVDRRVLVLRNHRRVGRKIARIAGSQIYKKPLFGGIFQGRKAPSIQNTDLTAR